MKSFKKRYGIGWRRLTKGKRYKRYLISRGGARLWDIEPGSEDVLDVAEGELSFTSFSEDTLRTFHYGTLWTMYAVQS